MKKELFRLEHVSKEYVQGDIVTKALDDINLTIYEGEIIVILGTSGSGKTTMLNIISGLDTCSSGKVYYKDKDITNYSDYKMTKFRKDNIGFIFQTYNLLRNLNVYENVMVGASLAKRKKYSINDILKLVHLYDERKKNIEKLSGGQQQRVSIARALAKNPSIMFCDEPTGALDEETGKVVLDSLVEVNDKLKTTLVIITHNPGIAYLGDRVIKMNSGHIIDMYENEEKMKVEEIPWG